MYGQTVAPPPGLRGVEAAVQGGEPREVDFGLSPSSAVVAFDEMKIYRIGEGNPRHPPFDEEHR